MASRSERDRAIRGVASSRARFAVHVLLAATAVVSLILEPEITLHILFGSAFVSFVAVHLAQRRQVARRLAGRLSAPWRLRHPSVRLAVADAVLLAVTLAMVVSGFWDWLEGHPTRIRWHAITGVVLTGYLLVHTLRRRRRLASSRVR